MGRRGSTGATLHDTADEFQAATAQWVDDNGFGGQDPGTMPTGGVGTGAGGTAAGGTGDRRPWP